MDIKGNFTRQATLQGYLLHEMKHGNETIEPRIHHLSPQSQEENVSELLLHNKRA
jgi:hypothetical protein